MRQLLKVKKPLSPPVIAPTFKRAVMDSMAIPSWQKAEQITKAIVQAEGWEVIHRNTAGPFDVVATSGKRTRQIQVKLRNRVHSKVLARKIAREVLDSYKGKEYLPKGVTLEVWIYYKRNGSWKVLRLCYP